MNTDNTSMNDGTATRIIRAFASRLRVLRFAIPILALVAGTAFAETTTTLDYYVEYIESTGSQWIDTGVCGKSTIGIVADVMVLNSAGSSCLIGERSGGNDKLAFWINNSYKTAINCGSLDSGWQGGSIQNTRCVISNENSRLYVNGNMLYNGANQTFSSSLTMTLFFLRTSATALDKASNRPLCARIYGLEIYDSGDLVRDFRPCRVTITDSASGTSETKHGLWDAVNDVFYGDLSGGTDFTAGAQLGVVGAVSSFTASVARRTVTYTFRLANLDASQPSSVTLWVGPSNDENALVQVGNAVTVTSPDTDYTFTHTFDDFETTYYAQLRSTNAAAGSSTRSAIIPAKTLDTTTYTWKNSVAAGDWSDAANWDDNQSGDCFGYPKSTQATVIFAEGNASTVRFTEALSIGALNLSAPNLNTTFVQGGASTNATMLTVNGALNVNGAGGCITLSNVAVKTASEISVGTGRTLILRNAANLSVDNCDSYQGGLIRVDSDSWMSVFRLRIGGNGGGSGIEAGGLAISNGFVLVNSHAPLGYLRKGGAIRFEGAHPVLLFGNSGGYVRSDLANAGMSLDFLVPAGGYDGPPIRCRANQSYYFGNSGNNNGASVIPVRVLAESPAARVDATATTPLLSWAKGINASMVSLASLVDVDSTMLYGSSASSDYGFSAASSFSGRPFSIGVTIEGSTHANRLTISGTPEAIASPDLSPGYGHHDGYADGATVTATAPAFVQISDAKRAVVTGGTFYTIDPMTHGRDAGTAFSGASHSYVADGAWHEIEWVWDIEYLVTSRASGNGTASDSEWFRFGETASLSATPGEGYAVGRWDCDPILEIATGNPLTFTVTGPATNTAVFYPVVHVSPKGSDSNGGTSWSDAFMTIAAAVASRDTPYVIVSNGTYNITADIAIAKPAVVTSLTGDAKDVTVNRASGATHVFSLNHASALLRGIAIQGGSINGSGMGSGVYIMSAGGILENCIIRNSTAVNWGARGGVALASDYARLSRCIVTNCAGNESEGCAIYMTRGLMENCLITENRCKASARKGVVIMKGGRLENCTIAGNTGNLAAGVYTEGTAAVRNCLIGANTLSQSSAEADTVYCGKADAFVNCLAPVQINGSCLTGELGFQNAAAGDFHLNASSAAIDAASSEAGNYPLDLDGVSRPSGAAADIGCYEFDSSDAHVALSADATEGLSPFSVNFTVTATGLSGAASYAWDFDGDGTMDETTATASLSHTFTGNGAFAVSASVLDSNGHVLATSENTVTVKAYPSVVYVDASSATPAAPYATPATAATTLQDALDATIGGATAIVADGSYALTNTVSLDKGIRVVGNGADPDQVRFHPDGNRKIRLFHLNHHGAVLSGLTLEGGLRTEAYFRGGNLMIDRLGGTVTNCVIRNGQVEGLQAGGGAIYIPGDTADALVTHCVITNNAASCGGATTMGGGAIHQGSGTIRNCLIVGNYQLDSDTSTGLFGGAVAISGGLLESCTIAKNKAQYCAGVYATGGTVRNCAIADNVATVSDVAQHAVWAGSANCFSACISPVEINAGCVVEASPLAAPDAGDFRLAAGSAGIDAGVAADWMTGAKDLAGCDRIRGTAPDIGAYEADSTAFAASFAATETGGFAPFATTFAISVVNGGGAGYDYVCSLQGGTDPIASASFEGTDTSFSHTFAEPGHYRVVLTVTDRVTHTSYTVPGYVDIYAAPKTIHVVPAGTEGASPVAPYAGWETAATNLADALSEAIDGSEIVLSNGVHHCLENLFLAKAVAVRGLSGDPAESVITVNGGNHRLFTMRHADAVISGVTLDGRGISGDGQTGGLVYIHNDGGMVTNCVLRNGKARGWGQKGGAIYLNSPAGIVTHCVLTNNVIGCSDGRELGMAVYMADGRMENCLVFGNRASGSSCSTKDSGGAISVSGGTVANCTVVGNSHQYCPGVIAAGGTVANTIIAENVSTKLGGDAAVYLGDAACFTHCASDTLAINASCLAGDLAFRNAAGGDYTILHESAAIGAGDNAYVTEATDLLGNRRRRGVVDAGCYESQYSPTLIMLR